MTTNISQFDGPRLVGREELNALQKLTRICFGGQDISDEGESPTVYIPPKKVDSYVLTQRGKLISHISISHDQIKLYDGNIQVASIGGVCTHPDYRGKGLASYLLEFCTRKLVQEGARLMIISGDDGVYTRQGNVLQGRYIYFSITPGQSKSWRSTPAGLVLRRMTTADISSISQLYQAEPVHFVRQHADFLAVLNDRMGNTYVYADQWIVEREGQIVAYMFLGSPWEFELSKGIRHVGEFAGSRIALAETLPALWAAGNLQELSWPVAWQEFDLIRLLQDCGYGGSVAPLEGYTLRIVNFSGLMHDLRPILRARLGAKLLRGLRFEQSGALIGGTGLDRYTILRGQDRLELDGAGMTRLVMGTTEEMAPIKLPGALADVVPALFPLPSFLPGLNYH